MARGDIAGVVATLDEVSAAGGLLRGSAGLGARHRLRRRVAGTGRRGWPDYLLVSGATSEFLIVAQAGFWYFLVPTTWLVRDPLRTIAGLAVGVRTGLQFFFLQRIFL